jgi:hypothetical protein
LELGIGTALYVCHHHSAQREMTETLAGTVADIKEGKAEVKSKKGNTISKNGTEDDPAVVIEREGVSLLLYVLLKAADVRTMLSRGHMN